MGRRCRCPTLIGDFRARMSSHQPLLSRRFSKLAQLAGRSVLGDPPHRPGQMILRLDVRASTLPLDRSNLPS